MNRKTRPAESARRSPNIDPVWEEIVQAAQALRQREPALAGLLHRLVLCQPSLERALAVHIAGKLGHEELGASQLTEVLHEAFAQDEGFASACRADIRAVQERDPACRSCLQPVLFFKGFLALTAQRGAHYYWRAGQEGMALYLQSRISEVFGADIHPAARLGKGLMMDHATGVVIGETAVVGDNVSMLHGVTLGGTGREKGDRHPKIGQGVLISVGAKVLGNIRIGDCAKIGAGSVVLADVPPYTTAVGVPARIIGRVHGEEPARAMDHQLDEPELPPAKPAPASKATDSKATKG